MIDVMYGVREATRGGTLIMKVFRERLAHVPCRLPLLPAFRSFFKLKSGFRMPSPPGIMSNNSCNLALPTREMYCSNSPTSLSLHS